MTSYLSSPLPELISAAQAVAEEARSRFGGMSAAQLNWKSGPESWSVAQCFDHLLTAHRSYLPIFEKVQRGQHRATWWERFPLLPGFWGKMLIQAVGPDSARKMKAPQIFQPASSEVDARIIRRFLDQQDQLIRAMEAAKGLDFDRIVITSPVSKLITYSLLDACRVIVAHEQRHLLQAKRVTELAGFPPASP